MNGFDLSTVTNIYLGSTPVTEVYMGSTLIWPKDTFNYITEYFTIESLEDYNQIGIVDSDRPSIEISTNKYEWTTVTPDAAPTYFITLNAGEKVYIRGNNEAYYSDSWSTEGYFTSTGKFNVSGNIDSLVFLDSFPASERFFSSNAFTKLFYNATNLVSAEHLVLPNTTSYGCYEYMFGYCSSLTKAPELPATTLEGNCYKSMFNSCSSLTKAPKLPATSLSYNCYDGMFKYCTSLTTAPSLPATSLSEECYFCMFQGCSSLTKAPELPATYLANYCYGGMFMGCSSLTKAPELPATTLKNHCYANMFMSCSSLTKAPELPATTLVFNCYYSMFDGCSSLNYIKMLATKIPSSCMENWVYGVASSGTFVKDASTTLPTGESGIPDGWTVENFNDYSSEYFTIESLEDGNQIGIVDSNRPSISISTDKRTWKTVTPNAAPTYFITLNAGKKVYIKGSNNSYYDSSWSTEGYFTSTGKFNVYGNIMSLIYADDFKNKTTLQSSNTFGNLFCNANKLISAEHLVLPATTLANNCYEGMFLYCTSLTTAPELPATILADRCYANMFDGCSSLTKAPELPATTLSDWCYYFMFASCSSLNYIKMLATDVSAILCLEWWVSGVASSGTFVKQASTTLPTGTSGIPEGWEVITT